MTVGKRKSLTGSVQETVGGSVPKRSRAARVTVVFTRFDGRYNDGSADDISLVLTKSP